jgi:hypothetical protein
LVPVAVHETWIRLVKPVKIVWALAHLLVVLLYEAVRGCMWERECVCVKNGKWESVMNWLMLNSSAPCHMTFMLTFWKIKRNRKQQSRFWWVRDCEARQDFRLLSLCHHPTNENCQHILTHCTRRHKSVAPVQSPTNLAATFPTLSSISQLYFSWDEVKLKDWFANEQKN